jgi:hypothetical protein
MMLSSTNKELEVKCSPFSCFLYFLPFFPDDRFFLRLPSGTAQRRLHDGAAQPC